MAPAIEDLCNQALRRIGYPTPIGYIYEGSRASRVAVEIYGQTRDDTMRANDYTFARRDVTLSLNGQVAPSPWLYEFTYPSDCLRIRQVMPNSIAATGLLNNGGFLMLDGLQPGWQTNDSSLPPGSFYSNGLFVSVTPGGAPSGSPLTFPGVTASQLLAIGAGPLINSPQAPGQLFINGASVGVAPGGTNVAAANFDPRPILFTDFNDQRISPPSKAILSMISPATLVYTGKITDPATFDANYVEALIENLARRLAPALAGTNAVPIDDALAESATNAALGAQANRPPGLVTQRAIGGGGQQQRNE